MSSGNLTGGGSRNRKQAKSNPACDAKRILGWDIIKRKNNFLFRGARGISTRINIGLGYLSRSP